MHRVIHIFGVFDVDKQEDKCSKPTEIDKVDVEKSNCGFVDNSGFCCKARDFRWVLFAKGSLFFYGQNFFEWVKFFCKNISTPSALGNPAFWIDRENGFPYNNDACLVKNLS